MPKHNDAPLRTLIIALAPQLETLQGEHRQLTLRRAAAVVRGYDADGQKRLIATVCEVMRISETVFRQIMAEE